MSAIEMMQSRLEPDVIETMRRYGDFDTVCLASIAVSLKRLADTVNGDRVAEQFGGLSNMAWEMGRAFEAGRRTDR